MAVAKWKHYLVGNHFIIRTDQKSLKHILDQKVDTLLQQRWISKLLGLDYEVHYKKGCHNKAADALSRREHGNCTIVTLIIPNWINEVQKSYEHDPDFQPIIQAKIIQADSHPEYTLQVGVLRKDGKPLQIPDQAWAYITMDFIEGLPKSDAEVVAKAFIDHIYKLHGLPINIVTDRDKVFTSKFWQELLKGLGVNLSLSTAYHPQSEEQTE
ncbi:UNVERIFIED_CONTAM: hypothetical protein Sradi_6199600 [Sesamum radiatum]|uniref:Integrase catalytic domain-containing protein n=1 Tax=Sesamum radiatum TaxID=300843 RepID=A0AAW2K9B4_SESRA